MRLNSFKYYEYEDTKKEWNLDSFLPTDINVIVGVNASGKTRTLNILSGLAKYINGSIPVVPHMSGCYETEFEHESKKYIYKLKIKDEKIILEEYTIDGKFYIQRTDSETTSLYFAEAKNYLKVGIDANRIVIATKKDSIQHPFFEPLLQWAELCHMNFITMGQTVVADLKSDRIGLDMKKSTHVVKNFHFAFKKHGKSFKNQILLDLKEIGYSISDILVIPFGSESGFKIEALVQDNLPFELAVKEDDLECIVSQSVMSTGMFRALSLIIQLNIIFFEKKTVTSTLIIDDIGEGLDFTRSSKLIKLIVEKTKNLNIQVFMSTNDRFIMNGIDLKYWAIIRREGAHVKVFNINNNADKLEDFELTGQNNFEFFASDFYLHGFGDAELNE